MRDYSLLDKFLDERVLDAHPKYVYEDQSNMKIAALGLNRLTELGVGKGAKVVDIGCGTGRDLKFMHELGFDCVGVNFLASELTEIIAQDGTKLKTECCDQSFTPWDNETFDVVWSRHCLEHSIMPYFTLFEYNRILKMGGICYVELPAPNTMGYHETNPNHYAVMGKMMWQELFKRCGFEVIETKQVLFDFDTPDGEHIPGGDEFYVYYLRKTSLPICGHFRDIDNRGATMEPFQK